ncbi:hypothetical protein [Ferrigenium kumadai]|nr:hypothetical protein [Ferrigenium kumadai]
MTNAKNLKKDLSNISLSFPEVSSSAGQHAGPQGDILLADSGVRYSVKNVVAATVAHGRKEAGQKNRPCGRR